VKEIKQHTGSSPTLPSSNEAGAGANAHPSVTNEIIAQNYSLNKGKNFIQKNYFRKCVGYIYTLQNHFRGWGLSSFNTHTHKLLIPTMY